MQVPCPTQHLHELFTHLYHAFRGIAPTHSRDPACCPSVNSPALFQDAVLIGDLLRDTLCLKLSPLYGRHFETPLLELPLHRSQLLTQGSQLVPQLCIPGLGFCSLALLPSVRCESCKSLFYSSLLLFFLNSPKCEQPASHGSPDCVLYTYAEKSCVSTNDKQAVFSKFLLGILPRVDRGYSSLDRLLEPCARSRTVARTDPTAERQGELRRLSMKVKEESEKAGLRLSLQKPGFIASNPITSWQIDGKNNGNSDRLYLLGLQNCWGQ